ncbi:DEAD/DEAH box helicase [Polyangium jinanense]|uniref:DEAD/DEAH box helicase n=1 Tax=Polyangium jinanense TaxID=2829994 RepID=A0A9X3X8Z7_9BACT|nr:SNF2-related protein [Polyangium jinanense]MDC3985922.1 DEAD/DEAH box helicase [Polyangium jinanense]
MSFADATLSAAHSPRAFALHRAACEWQLDRPILIRGEDDILSREQITVKPYAHQVKNLLTFCRLAPVALLADDVGLGKTVSAGLILTELVLRKKVRKALVICPRILVAQWERELVDKFKLPVVTAMGKEIREVIRVDRGVVVTTYETVRDHLEAIGNAGIQMLILDEAHRLRRLHGSDEPPLLATRIRQALEQRRFKFVLLLTATPIQNRLWDLYSLIDCLTVAKGHRHPLGTPDQFAKKYIKGPRQKALEVHPGMLREFRGHVRRYIARTRRADADLSFPKREVKLHLVDASQAERDLSRMLGHHMNDLGKLSQIHLAQALMSSPQALRAQLANMVSTSPCLDECLKAVEQFVDEGRPVAKMLGLGSIIDELEKARPNDFRLVIFTLRRETQDAIGAFLKGRNVSHGFIRGGGGRANQEAIERFTKETPEVHVLVSTEAGAEGVNLQAANVLVNYDLPWNPMVLEQRIGRVQRLGSKYESVTVLNLVVVKSVEEHVVARLAQKLQMIGDTIGEIDAILESPGASRGDDAGESFQDMIRKLVVKSLQGKSMDEAVRREEASIDEAKRLRDRNQSKIEKQLDGLDELHTSGPTAPDLPVREPSMTLEEFVLAALAEEGAAVTRSDDGAFRVVPQKGQPFQAIIGAASDGGAPRNITVYAPGEAAFELLVERWANRDGALVHDLRGATDRDLRAVAERWCAEFPGVVLRDLQRMDVREVFQGEVDCEAQAVVAHDEYETILSVDLRLEGHEKIPAEQPAHTLLAEHAYVSNLFDGAARVIEAAVGNDARVREFCRFYGERRTEELKRAQQGSTAAARVVEEAFTPVLQASVIGVRGHRYEVVRIHITAELDAVPYETEFDVVPATSQILSGPTLDTCEQSMRRVPASWLETCCASKKRVLRHLLEPSERSGKRALPKHLERSAITGQRLLVSEMERSAVSGALAEPELLVASEMSAKKGLPSEVATCDFTGAKVLVNELVESQVSGRKLRMDQQAASVVSGNVGHVSELERCEVSGQHVLASERVLSDVSGRWFRNDSIIRSEKPPHRIGAATEGAKCAVTGKVLLCDEVATSDASQKVVDKALLVTSAVSNKRALDSELVTCVLSGKRVLPQEVRVCAVTGRRALPSLMVKSAAEKSTRYMLPGSDVRSAISNAPMAPEEVYTCPWLEVGVLPQETARCQRTGLRVARTALNTNGELDALRRVLDDPRQGYDAPDVVEWLKRDGFYRMKTPQWAAAIASPSGRLLAVHVRAGGFGTTDDGMLFERSPIDGALRRTGGYTVGDTKANGWVWGRDVR